MLIYFQQRENYLHIQQTQRKKNSEKHVAQETSLWQQSITFAILYMTLNEKKICASFLCQRQLYFNDENPTTLCDILVIPWSSLSLSSSLFFPWLYTKCKNSQVKYI